MSSHFCVFHASLLISCRLLMVLSLSASQICPPPLLPLTKENHSPPSGLSWDTPAPWHPPQSPEL